jgi:glycosyltransferase involved in cell wall biosynthesis
MEPLQKKINRRNFLRIFMRILLSCDPGIAVPPHSYGGIERIVDALVRAYEKEGHSVALWADAHSTSPASSFFPINPEPVYQKGITLQRARELQTVVKKFQPHVVHSFSRLAYLLPLLPSRLPKIMSYQRHTGGWNLRLSHYLAHGSLHFTGCSEFICHMGQRSGGSWTCIPNFVELDRYTFQPKVEADAPLVFLSRIESMKGPDWAIQIARQSGKRLILAGNKPEAAHELLFWQREIEPWLGRDGIEWVGPVNDHQKNELLGRACAMIVPIQWDEPFGIVFAEALACGTPVISCPRGALPEIITHGQHGYLIQSTSEGVESVQKIQHLSRSLCRTQAQEKFSLESATSRYLDLYRQVTGLTSSPHAQS